MNRVKQEMMNKPEAKDVTVKERVTITNTRKIRLKEDRTKYASEIENVCR